MQYQQIKSDLRGVAFTNPTPFDDTGDTIQHDKLADNVQHVVEAGGRLIIPCGNTGEYYSLTDQERISVVETIVEAVGDTATIVGGVGGSTKSAIALAKAYEEQGADAIMIMHPVHTYQHQAGLIEYYREIVESTDLGVVLYKRGQEVTHDLLADLTTYENVVGVKYAVNDIKGFAEAVSTIEGDIVWSNGIAERYAPSFAIEGAEGFTTGIGNFIPERVIELMDALEAENWDHARELRDQLRPLENLREESGAGNSLSAANNVPVVKHGMELAGLYGGPVREPLVDLSTEDKQRTKEYYEQMTTGPTNTLPHDE
ncbi:dihydrodipicolinate synthase family protein [Halorubrum sp. AD140]|uniref:dihydrodipicolinate synthase family protein n=1 Tax=Halorubrum sp. AD140 TaxID=3050073 RepID=UPI002ACC79F0|nr:dihydrodipicolinate synthase family protein [Halorubrum sp. AD140]MDZ5811411.1 dihydrodipicolinate synthase family protein [Halorubrum sp. AD140]